MFSRHQQALTEALRGGNWDEAARILCKGTQTLEHRGQMRLYGAVDRVDRGFHGDGTNKPIPPIKPPISEGAQIHIPAAGADDDDRAGEAGLGIDSERPSRFTHLWAVKFATVAKTGTTETEYAYSDGFECANAKGDRTTTVPIRVFHTSGAPAVDSVVPYLRTTDGLAWGLSTGSTAGTRLTGLLVGALTSVDETFTVNNVEAICGTSPVAYPSGTITVYNTHHWDADDGALVRIEWHETHARWEAYQIDCPE